MSIFNRFSRTDTPNPSSSEPPTPVAPVPTPPAETPAQEPAWAAPIRVLAEGQNKLTTMMEALVERSSQPAPQPVVQAPPIEDVDPQEINRMISENEGDVGGTVKRLVTAEVERFKRTHFDPFAQQGLAAVSDLSTQMARQQMPLYNEDATIKREVDQTIATLPPEMRTNAQAHLAIYQAVVGKHLDRIVAQRVEAAARREDDEPVGTPARAGRSTQQVHNEVSGRELPTANDLGGEQAEMALRATGRTQDDLAKKLGYKDWSDYMEKAAAVGYFGAQEQ